MTVLIAAGDVRVVRTTSSSGITFAGEKKCMPITSSGREVALAIVSISRVEVLVARIAPRLRDRLEFRENFALQVHALEHRLDDDVGVAQIAVVERRAYQCHAAAPCPPP